MWLFPVSYLVLESLRSQFLVEGSDLGGKTLKVVFYLQLLKIKANTVQRNLLLTLIVISNMVHQQANLQKTTSLT